MSEARRHEVVEQEDYGGPDHEEARLPELDNAVRAGGDQHRSHEAKTQVWVNEFRRI